MRISRFYQIQKTLLQFGLDELIPQQWQPWYARLARRCLFWLRNRHPDQPVGVRLRLALQSLGPVWIKFGQMLSTRRDLFPPQLADELAKLQDKVPPFDGVLAQQLIEQALELDSITQLFDSFDTVPLASASIAQVHSARLRMADGNVADVVIKVIRPDIRQQILADLALMDTLADAAARFLPDGKRLRPREVVQEYRKTILDELDLQREAANAIQLRRNFDGSDSLYIPFVYSDYSRGNVMVMERIYGIPVSDIAALHAQGTDMELLAKRGVEVFFTQVFRDSFFHADMHPGNIFVSRDTPANPKYIGIDCGIVGTLNAEDKRYLAENFVAFFNRDYKKVAQLHVDSGWVPAHTKVEEFESAIRTVCEPIFQKPLAEISFGHVLLNLFNTARRFEMQVQPQLVLLQKTLLYIEGLGRQLYPQLDLWKTAKPFLENWVKQQVGLPAVWRQIKDNLPFWAEKLPQMPNLLHQYLEQGPKQQRQLLQLLTQLQQQQARARVQIVSATFAAASLISASIVFFQGSMALAVLLFAGSIGFAIKALN
ncbi:MAG: ubiquinone biosynthesis regulatory protein kinase UbiB [Gammaproteobacteria bacterium]|nr:ubiquinone biosynthesis regulatory protein kinase UbiB [Gammaproteobacteria bacterium]MBU1557086.1 ubiquinone biosynthesis regulatory protein kinase UbiB [Gammaproteobacteria bacterium]MBU2070863.1 ubiquinone biosynthesis regulatory protein kinase UbiB [Gammaproteobacteria bacterium]MBU2185044.1 ubiquinone biosynthesis regulatory protein kinase UbiB [Gammaproteobacteria bacterium]MBU2204069.1 ubiquinone biosynthesis regulatory protein kinase UbiB [Gammaproteobacteria bacterium]